MAKRNTVSLSTRLSLYIISVTALVLILLFVSLMAYNYRKVRSDAEEKAVLILQETVAKVDSEFRSVETAVDNLAGFVWEKTGDLGSLHKLTTRILLSNSQIKGSVVALEPDYFPGASAVYTPYSYRSKEGAVVEQVFRLSDYHYYSMEWYDTPRETLGTHWSDPYIEPMGANEMIVTYSRPLLDGGAFRGVVTADLSLEWLDEMVNGIETYPDSYNYVIDPHGDLIVNTGEDFYGNIFELAANSRDSVYYGNFLTISAGHSGRQKMEYNGKRSYAFYAPIPSTGWMLVVISPLNQVYAGLSRFFVIISVILLAGLVLLLFLCHKVIKRGTRPLEQFAAAAVNIADGKFDTALPRDMNSAETIALRDSFDFMQRSLVKYVEDLKATTAAKERIDSELQIANEIQTGMLPSVFPEYPDVYGIQRPAKEVGGDVYDFYVSQGRLYFIIGDVSGKGVPASLFMAIARVLFRSLTKECDDMSEVVSSMNRSIIDINESGQFITLMTGVLDLRSGTLSFCNAGHPPPVLIREGAEVAAMDIKPNIPIGILAGYVYVPETLAMSPGDILFMYTDGVTEAENEEAELFTSDRLLDVIKGYGDIKKGRQLCESVMHDIDMYAGAMPQSDDITMLSIGLNINPPTSISINPEVRELMFVHDFVTSLGFNDEGIISDLDLVLEEVVSNIILHGFDDEQADKGVIDISFNQDVDTVSFTVKDSGRAFDPTGFDTVDIGQPSAERPVGGLGLHLVGQIMDSVEYRRDGGRNILTITKKLI